MLLNSNEYEPLITAVNQQRTEESQSEPFTVQASVTPMASLIDIEIM